MRAPVVDNLVRPPKENRRIGARLTLLAFLHSPPAVVGKGLLIPSGIFIGRRLKE